MGIDPASYSTSATKADVASVAISTAVALDCIVNALNAIRSGRPVTDSEMDRINSVARDLQMHFERLSGWTAS